MIFIGSKENSLYKETKKLKERKARKNNVIRMKDYKKKMNANKKPYTHKCTVCGITDIDDPDMDFRYCGECDGKHAYCSKHIKNHKHIKNNKSVD